MSSAKLIVATKIIASPQGKPQFYRWSDGFEASRGGLAQLWAQLGVRPNGPGVALDDQAPWAEIRSAICRGRDR